LVKSIVLYSLRIQIKHMYLPVSYFKVPLTVCLFLHFLALFNNIFDLLLTSILLTYTRKCSPSKDGRFLDVSVICLAAVSVTRVTSQLPLAAARIGKVSVSQIMPTVQFSASARLVT